MNYSRRWWWWWCWWYIQVIILAMISNCVFICKSMWKCCASTEWYWNEWYCVRNTLQGIFNNIYSDKGTNNSESTAFYTENTIQVAGKGVFLSHCICFFYNRLQLWNTLTTQIHIDFSLFFSIHCNTFFRHYQICGNKIFSGWVHFKYKSKHNEHIIW